MFRHPPESKGSASIIAEAFSCGCLNNHNLIGGVYKTAFDDAIHATNIFYAREDHKERYFVMPFGEKRALSLLETCK